MRGDQLHNRVRTKLAAIDTSFEGRGSEVYGPYYRRAAVTASYDPEELRHLVGGGSDDEMYSVLADSVVSAEADSWSLNESIKRDVLGELARPEAVIAVLDQIPSRPDEPVQRMFEAYLRGTAPPLQEQSLDELIGTLRVCNWLPEHLARQVDLPDRGFIQAYIDRTDLLQPFRWLAGEHFSGRVQELRELRHYVGVHHPSSGIHLLAREVREIVNLHKEPPLLIHGPGGIGKSTLVARFVLDHVDLENEDRFPFVYIDFDCPGMLPDQPATLLLEAVRQLGVRYPESRRHAESVREAWHHRLQRSSAEKTSGAAVVNSFAEDFRRLLFSMSFGEKPLLFVLDTFEEVQSMGDGFVREVGDFLSLLQTIWPRLRTVISSRAPVTAFSFKPRELALGDLDQEAAVGFLRGRGVDPDAAVQLARRLGGNPLTLRMGAELLRRERTKDLRGIDTHRYFFVRLKSEQVQGQLFRRILWHVGRVDARIRKLAHPGLVLRRITPELIRDVLAEPCDLELKPEEAQELFESVGREVSLLEPDRNGGLRHRSDVRRVMLRLLESDQPDTVREIHERAVGFYQRVHEEAETEEQRRMLRTEELYHRLALGEDSATLDARWMPGIEKDLAGAMEEMSAREQAYLASRLGQTVQGSVLAMADLQTWERSTEALVRSLLELGRLEDALVALGQRSDRSAESTLHLLDVTVFERLGRWPEAASAADRAIESASEAGNFSLTFELLLARARLAGRMGDPSGASMRIDEAAALADGAKNGLMDLRAGLAYGRYVAAPDAPAAKRLAATFLDLSEDTLKKYVDVVVDAAAQLGAVQPLMLLRAVRIAGLQDADGVERRRLTRALLAWDEEYSRRTGEPVGRLAREAGVSVRENVAEGWRRVAESTSAALLNGTICTLLERPSLPMALVDSLVAIFVRRTERDADRKPERPRSEQPLGAAPADIQAGHPVHSRLELSEGKGTLLRDAVVESFSFQELVQVLNVRLSRSLHTISQRFDYSDLVSDLIRSAERDGSLAELVTTLLDARPEAPALQSFAQEIGLASVTLLPHDLDTLLKVSSSLLDPGEWRRRLGVLEAQVCRLEVANAAGTGFLIGPDHILTAREVIHPLIRKVVDPREVVIRFDFRSIQADEREIIVSPGVTSRLSKDWLVHDQGDAVVLAVDGSPGDQPIGMAHAAYEEMARTRGWIRPSRRPPRMQWMQPLFILGCARHSLKVDYSVQANVVLSDGGRYIRYDVAASPQANGSPCFDENWELVALHLRYDSELERGEGFLVDAVMGAFEQAATI